MQNTTAHSFVFVTGDPEHDHLSCTICQEDNAPATVVLLLEKSASDRLTCGHRFCKLCAAQALRSKQCPMCKSAVFTFREDEFARQAYEERRLRILQEHTFEDVIQELRDARLEIRRLKAAQTMPRTFETPKITGSTALPALASLAKSGQIEPPTQSLSSAVYNTELPSNLRQKLEKLHSNPRLPTNDLRPPSQSSNTHCSTKTSSSTSSSSTLTKRRQEPPTPITSTVKDELRTLPAILFVLSFMAVYAFYMTVLPERFSWIAVITLFMFFSYVSFDYGRNLSNPTSER